MTISRTRRLIDEATHQEVFGWVLQRLARGGLLRAPGVAGPAAFPSPEQLPSWVGVCPGQQETAGQSYSQTPVDSAYASASAKRCCSSSGT